MSIPALPADPDQHLTADEVTANKILAPFDIQIVKIGGEFTLRGNLTGLDAAYLHVETSRQIPGSVKDSITVFGQRREKLFADCLAEHGHPKALDHTAKDPETGVDPNAAPSQLYADCQATVLARYGLRFEGDTPDRLHRAKGPDAKLYESR
ncbi:hypothetical protein ACFV9C_04985 [Kribbella sp. NPDC059898]|uniref:hypothetical protein n=1 Tax=Kribbella sp. NPDC059898 TaxID=3346995 RepID=UPI00364EB03D